MTGEALPPLPGAPAYRGWARMAFALGAIFLRYRMLVVAVGVVFFGLFVLPKLLGRRSYTAEASFVPQERNESSSGLASLAAQFGVALPGRSVAESPAFYRELIDSREVLSRVVQTVYHVPTPAGDSATLLDIWDVPGATHEARVEEAVRLLREDKVVITPRETGTVQLRIRSSNPRLAAAVVQRILDLVNEFNVRRRQSQAGAERRFVDARLMEARADLAQAEARLGEFLRSNRQVASSSTAKFELDRLERSVALYQQVVNSLSQAFEQARISEARNIPVITIIESPVVPASPNRRGLVVRGLKALAGAVVVSLAIALVLEFFRQAGARRDDELVELRALWGDTLQDLRHPLRAVRRAVRRG